MSRNILVTDFQGTGADIMIFSNLQTAESIEHRLIDKEQQYGEVYEIPTAELEYYIYEPCYLKD
jgi:hypothetical protein